jgi:hypothetical protein
LRILFSAQSLISACVKKNTSPTRIDTGKLATEKRGNIVQSGASNTPEQSRTQKQQVATVKNKTTTKKMGGFDF